MSIVVVIEQISVAELHERILAARSSEDAHGLTLIDVREDVELAGGRIEGAKHVPLGTVPDRLDEFDGSPTYVICRAGGRSMRACEFAAAHGHRVVNVAGGMLAWGDAGFEITHG